MTLRELWDSQRPTIGGWSTIADPFAAELLGRAGFDWIAIDLQHGLAGPDRLPTLLQALAVSRTPAFVRVPWNEPVGIMRALDMGAEGVIVPMVNGPEDAHAAVGACRYPPDGFRSWGPIRAALDVPGYDPTLGNRRVICTVMIETREALERIDEIVAVPGIDAVFVGPSDLALAHGLPPTLAVQGAEHRRLVERVLAACTGSAVLPGVYAGSPEMVRTWRSAGFLMLALSSDSVLLRQAATAIVAEAREALAVEEPVEAPAS